MQKVDWRKTLNHLYVPTARQVVEVDVPEMRFLKVDGEGPDHFGRVRAGINRALLPLLRPQVHGQEARGG